MNNPQQHEIVQWFYSNPFCTRWLFATYSALSILGGLGLISKQSVYYDFTTVLGQFQFWRVATCFFNYELSISAIFQLYFLYTYSKQLETSPVFLGRTADYLYFLIVTMTFSIVSATVFYNPYLLSQSLIMSIVFLWSRHYKDVNVSFFFSLRFKGAYLPYVLMIYELLSRNGSIPYADIIGFFSAYLYHYLHDIYPSTGGVNYLKTPQFIANFFPAVAATSNSGVYFQPGTARGQPQTTSGYTWGKGRRLGN
ncbi:DER1-domain-containing protein [Basidiobolus meristosporus CBS 931.73]|uniref:Derlin n=1 Tax=Basidiobolus meristosporus CBS 931.73 TaxID=1314790 RepID=A0A1Y1YJ58_9FUNG|nr:DER1-domain-containing protein [Basidiobolus meristosporus CBS 931.73]|eukprot:ORX97893.1 DER1-domain-containing protein [Basidiobolus meristosporus CBS 931.73]